MTQESEHCFSRFLFCVCGSNRATSYCQICQSVLGNDVSELSDFTAFSCAFENSTQSLFGFSLFFHFFAPFPVDTVLRFFSCDKLDLTGNCVRVNFVATLTPFY